MQKIWVPLFTLLLLAGSYSRKRPAGRVENAQPSPTDWIQFQTDEPAETILYFPDYVDGGGWSVQLALSNIDPEIAAQVRVEVFDEDGRPVSDLFEEESRFRIPSLGSRVLNSAGAGAIRRGWIEVESDSASVSGLLTYRQSETGVEVSVKPVELGSQFALFVEESSPGTRVRGGCSGGSAAVHGEVSD